MATVTDIRSAGTDLSLTPSPIYEPLNAPSPLTDTVLSRFGEDYDLSTNSNLYKFLLALCGETGAGSIKKQMLYPRLQSQLQATQFTDLDKLYGNPLGLPRKQEESYTVDPREEALTQDVWSDVKIKDAQYRARCLTWVRAIMNGGTPTGIKLAAEAACGIECDVFEQYRYIENSFSDQPVSYPNYGKTISRQEFIIIPQATAIPLSDQRLIHHLVDKIKPVGTICTITSVGPTRVQQNVQRVAATSEAFFIKRLVTGRTDINWPAINLSQGLWITTSEEEAPTFAFMDTQESSTYLTIVDVTASSEHIGNFNTTQQSLFGNLNYQVDTFFIFAASNSYVKSFAPIQLSIPWTASA